MYTKRNLLSTILAVAILLLTAIPARPATPEQIEAAINDGITWLLCEQNDNGSWGNYAYVAVTGLTVVKLQDRARELPTSDYDDEIQAGLDYIFGQATVVLDPGYISWDGWQETYHTGIAMMAIANDGDLSQVVSVAGSDVDGMTYEDVLDGSVNYFMMSQNANGGWGYEGGGPSWSDQSNTGYAVLGLSYAENAGITIPGLIGTGLDNWIGFIQNTSGGSDDGGSGYGGPNDWVNELKTGNLIFEMTFRGIGPGNPSFDDAIAYIERHWKDASSDPGWGYSLGQPHYQAMYCLMKGLQSSGVDLIDTDGDGVSDDDWFNQEPPASPAQDFASAIVATQQGDGYWPYDYWGDEYLATAWALLTLQKVTILHHIEVEIDIKPGSSPNSINPKSKGTIPVAILSTATFNATEEVDKTSLTFGRTGDEESLAKWTKSNEDVNGDGLDDVVCHFNTQDTGFQKGDTEATLTGVTIDGIPISGTDSVRIVPKGKN